MGLFVNSQCYLSLSGDESVLTLVEEGEVRTSCIEIHMDSTSLDFFY